MGITMTAEFRAALDLLESGQSLYLTGRAGTGKSTLIRHFMDTTSRRFLTAAPTGIAALNVGGFTLHRLFSFPIGVTVDDVRQMRTIPRRYGAQLRRIDTLIIDEVSMVRADLFDCVAASLEQHGPRPGTPFGGVQLILVGDVLQLPPVVTASEEEYFSSTYETPYFFSAHAYDRERFPALELTHVFRQGSDDTLRTILNNVRDGSIGEDELALLNTRVAPDFAPKDDEFWVALAGTNTIVTARNRRRLADLPGPEHHSSARIEGEVNTGGIIAEEELTYKVGAQVIMLNNDRDDRWVNGTLGVVTDVRTGEGDTREDADPLECTAVGILLADGTHVRVEPHTWEQQRPVVNDGRLTYERTGTFTQLPFKLAWALTIHKSQGQTLPRVIIDLPQGTFLPGQLYVALSRCTSLDGLVLTHPLTLDDVKIDRRLTDFLANTRRIGTQPSPVCALHVIPALLESGFVRPVEIVLGFADGRVFTTLVNPLRPIGDGPHGLSTEALQLAPRLADVWPVIGRLIDGHVLVAEDAEDAVALLRAELDRQDANVSFPDVFTIEGFTSEEESAAKRAVALARLATSKLGDGHAGCVRAGEAGPGYYLSRDRGLLPDPDSPSGRLSRLWADAFSPDHTEAPVESPESPDTLDPLAHLWSDVLGLEAESEGRSEPTLQPVEALEARAAECAAFLARASEREPLSDTNARILGALAEQLGTPILDA